MLLSFVTVGVLVFIINFGCHLLRYPDVPCVSHTLSVTFEDTHRQAVIDAINTIGEISMTGSLQIVDLLEQPGAILVRWDEEVRYGSLYM